MALVEWADNIAVSDNPPHTYWPAQVASRKFSDDKLAEQMRLHALPEAWTAMRYGRLPGRPAQAHGICCPRCLHALAQQFLHRALPGCGCPADAGTHRWHACQTPVLSSLADLIEQGLLAVGAVLMPDDPSIDALATVLENGHLEVEGQEYETPTEAAVASAGASVDGWRAG